MAIITKQGHAPLPATAVVGRTQLMAKGLAKLSGSTSAATHGCNHHLDPKIDPFSFLTDFEGLEDSNVVVVDFVRADDDEPSDW